MGSVFYRASGKCVSIQSMIMIHWPPRCYEKPQTIPQCTSLRTVLTSWAEPGETAGANHCCGQLPSNRNLRQAPTKLSNQTGVSVAGGQTIRCVKQVGLEESQIKLRHWERPLVLTHPHEIIERFHIKPVSKRCSATPIAGVHPVSLSTSSQM